MATTQIERLKMWLSSERIVTAVLFEAAFVKLQHDEPHGYLVVLAPCGHSFWSPVAVTLHERRTICTACWGLVSQALREELKRIEYRSVARNIDG